jgi:carnosine N-methyltransferase
LWTGSGLGRLPWEIGRLGFASQGNEFSFQMLLTSNYIFNVCNKQSTAVKIFPFIHTNSNHVKREHQLRAVKVPNVDISDKNLCSDFSTNAGEFLEVYRNDVEQWDCVATCFFIDTAKNIVEYIRTIYKILKPNGVWVNLGPLLYHYEDMPREVSIELSFDEVVEVIKEVGFEFLKNEERLCTYTRNSESMMQLQYKCQLFTCTKRK